MLRLARSVFTAFLGMAVLTMLAGCAATWPEAQTEKSGEEELWKSSTQEGLSGEVRKLVEKGQGLYENGQYSEGVDAFKVAADLDPENVAVLASLGYGQSKLGEYESAVYSIERALALQPNDKSLKTSYAYNLGMAGKMDRAEGVYKELAKDNPTDDKLYKNLAVAYAKNQRLAQAVMAYEKAAELNPGDWETWDTLGKICRDAKPPLFMPAIAAFEHIRGNHPQDAERMNAVQALGRLYVQTHTFCKAAQMFGMVDQYTPLSKDDRAEYARALDKCGSVAAAIDQYSMVYAADTTDVKVLCRLAFLQIDNEQFEKAADISGKGLQDHPGDACLYCSWGKALEKLGKYEEAIEKFQNAWNDASWGPYASKQIERQNTLIKLREERKLQGGPEGG